MMCYAPMFTTIKLLMNKEMSAFTSFHAPPESLQYPILRHTSDRGAFEEEKKGWKQIGINVTSRA